MFYACKKLESFFVASLLHQKTKTKNKKHIVTISFSPSLSTRHSSDQLSSSSYHIVPLCKCSHYLQPQSACCPSGLQPMFWQGHNPEQSHHHQIYSLVRLGNNFVVVDPIKASLSLSFTPTLPDSLGFDFTNSFFFPGVPLFFFLPFFFFNLFKYIRL